MCYTVIVTLSSPAVSHTYRLKYENVALHSIH
jgi:hypothetical protein